MLTSSRSFFVASFFIRRLHVDLVTSKTLLKVQSRFDIQSAYSTNFFNRKNSLDKRIAIQAIASHRTKGDLEMFRCPEIVEPVTMVTLVVVMVAAVARCKHDEWRVPPRSCQRAAFEPSLPLCSSISHIALWILHNALTRTTASLRGKRIFRYFSYRGCPRFACSTSSFIRTFERSRLRS